MAEVAAPKKSRVLCVRLEQDLYDAVAACARDHKWSLAFTVHEILQLYFLSSGPLVIDFGCQEVTGDE